MNPPAEVAKRRRGALAVGAVVMAAVAPYAPSVVFGFTFDDTHTILEHPGVRGPLSLVNLLLRDFWGRSFVNSIGSWRPLTTLTYWIDWHLAAGLPWAFHVSNLALYTVLLLLLARFLSRFFGAELGSASRLAIVGVFGALAIHADVVPSATGRAEILAALWGLLALMAPLRLEGPVRTREVLLTAGASLLAIGAKESALPMALLAPLLAYRWHAARGTDRRAPMIALTAANTVVLFGIVAFRVLRMPWWSLGVDRATENALLAAAPAERLPGAGEVFVEYLQHTAWPARLAPDYSYAGIIPGHAPFRAAAGIALLVLVVGSCFAGRKRAPGIPDAAAGLVRRLVGGSSAAPNPPHPHSRTGSTHRKSTLGRAKRSARSRLGLLWLKSVSLRAMDCGGAMTSHCSLPPYKRARPWRARAAIWRWPLPTRGDSKTPPGSSSSPTRFLPAILHLCRTRPFRPAGIVSPSASASPSWVKVQARPPCATQYGRRPAPFGVGATPTSQRLSKSGTRTCRRHHDPHASSRDR